MAKSKVLIVVVGGLIQGLYSAGQEVDVCVVDWDNLKAGGDPAQEVTVHAMADFNGMYADALSLDLKDELESEVHAKLKRLDAEFPLTVVEDEDEDDGEASNFVGGFNVNDMRKQAVKCGYLLTYVQGCEVGKVFNKISDVGNGISWETVDAAVEIWAKENGVEPSTVWQPMLTDTGRMVGYEGEVHQVFSFQVWLTEESLMKTYPNCTPEEYDLSDIEEPTFMDAPAYSDINYN
jgi:hypothetical protein